MKMKNRIDYIRERLPKHMVPSFNKIVAENKDAKDFNIFLQAYSETIDEVELAPIQAWDAFCSREINATVEEAPEEVANTEEEPCETCTEIEDIPCGNMEGDNEVKGETCIEAE